MIKINVRKLEKEVTKRMKKFYNKDAYFAIDKITTEYFDTDKTITICGRAGYDYTNEDGKIKSEQINISFMIDESIESVKECAAVIYYYVMNAFDAGLEVSTWE